MSAHSDSLIRAKEIPGLISMGLINSVYMFILTLWSIPTYFQVPAIFRLDMTLWYLYRFIIPPQKLQLDREHTPYSQTSLSYGETPYFTIKKILSRLSFDPKTSLFIDLGCGRGQLPLFVSHLYKCRSAGVDIVPTYINAIKAYAKKRGITRVRYIQKDIQDTRFANATIVYIAWTCLDPHIRAKIIQSCERLKPGSIVICTTYPIENPEFSPMESLKGWFSWGRASVHIYKKN